MASPIQAPLTFAVIACALVPPACGDNTGDATATDTTSTSTGSSSSDGTTTATAGSSGSTTGAPTTGDTTGDTTTGSTTAPTSGGPTSTSSSTSGGVEACMTLLCGVPAGCCAAGEECLSGSCVPACPGGVRCGADDAICCADGEVCLADACALPLGPCQGPGDCAAGQYCEPLLGQCLPLPDAPGCGLDAIAVAPEWEWTANEVISTPMIADVDGDGTPDVVVNTTRIGANDYRLGEIVLLDGATGAEKWRITHEPQNNKFGSNGRSSVAVGDVSGDGLPDIIYAGRAEGNSFVSPIHAVDGNGQLLWTSRLADDSVAKARVDNGSATVVNLDADPEAEIAFGAMILDHDGLVVWNQNNNGPQYGTPLNNNAPIYFGGLATVADLDGDNKPELITGREAWTIDWVVGDPPTVTLSLFWANNNNPNPQHNNDGWPSIADFDGAQPQEPRQGSSLPPRYRNRSGNWRGLKPRRTTADSGGTPRSWRNAGGAKNALGGPEQPARRVSAIEAQVCSRPPHNERARTQRARSRQLRPRHRSPSSLESSS